MTNGNNDVRELEDLLTELEGQGALPVGTYSDEDDAVTQLMDAPLGEQEWMVQITPLDRRMMSTDQIALELASGSLVNRDMLVWRHGMGDWAPISSVEDLRAGGPTVDMQVVRPLPPPPAPLPPPPTPVPPRNGSSAYSSPGPLGRAPLPPPPSVPYSMPRPLTPPPEVAPPGPPLPLFNSAFAPSPPPNMGGMPELSSPFNVPPPAAAPMPPPAVARVNTQRPVAVDFSEMEPSRPAPMRLLVGSGVAALAMIAGTVYALSAGGVFDANPEPKPEPVAVASTSAVASKPSPEPAAAPVARAEAVPAEAKPSEPAPSAEEEQPQTQPVSAKDDGMVAAREPEAKAADEKEVAAESDSAPKAEKADRAEKAQKSVKATKADKSSEAAKVASAAAEEKGDESEAAQSRSERRSGRRNKRASAGADESGSESRTAAAAPRRSKPRATAAAAENVRAEVEETPKGGDAPGSTFNREAAKTALDDAAAQAKNCRPVGGPSGSGRVQVRYEPTGKVGAVSVLTPMFENTTTGSCVVMVFRRASVPAFTGSPAVVMNKNFEIP
jgi:uncharacterized protein DUF4339